MRCWIRGWCRDVGCNVLEYHAGWEGLHPASFCEASQLPDIVVKSATTRRSLIVKKAIGILARIVWLGICLASFVYAYKGYQGSSDWKMEEGLAFEMMVLSFPASFLIAAGLTLTGAGFGFLGLALPSSSKPEMTATWLLFEVAGYVQWFVVVPRLSRRWRRAHQGNES
jgi:hypothetical protein